MKKIITLIAFVFGLTILNAQVQTRTYTAVEAAGAINTTSWPLGQVKDNLILSWFQKLYVSGYSLTISGTNAINLPQPIISVVGNGTLTGTPGSYTINIGSGTSASTPTITLTSVGSGTITSNNGTNAGTSFTITFGASSGATYYEGTNLHLNAANVFSVTPSPIFAGSVTASKINGYVPIGAGSTNNYLTKWNSTQGITDAGWSIQGGNAILPDGAYNIGSLSFPVGTITGSILTFTTLSISGNATITKTLTVGSCIGCGGTDYFAGSNLALSANTFSLISSPTLSGTVTASVFVGAVRPNPSTTFTVATSATLTPTTFEGVTKFLDGSGSATAFNIYASNLTDGQMLRIDYQKTTAIDCVVTFPSGYIISASGAFNPITSTTGTLVSTASGRFEITIINHNGTIKVYCSQDVD